METHVFPLATRLDDICRVFPCLRLELVDCDFEGVWRVFIRSQENDHAEGTFE